VSSGCRDAAGAVVPLRHLEDRSNSLWLRAAVRPDAAPSCWAQVQPFEVEIVPRIVDLYLKEIQAPAPVRAAWAEMQQRGVAWKERYTKHARVETLRAGAPVSTKPVPMAMDVLLASAGAVGVDRPLSFQVLRDGQPLPDFPVELQNAVSGLGIWRRTDAQGRIAFSPPLAGRWILRGTDLRLSDTQRDYWESRFVTLAFDVPAASSGQYFQVEHPLDQPHAGQRHDQQRAADHHPAAVQRGASQRESQWQE
jgi:hypothetical protein